MNLEGYITTKLLKNKLFNSLAGIWYTNTIIIQIAIRLGLFSKDLIDMLWQCKDFYIVSQ